jgi:actin related protein 2/3 complex subunit 1A/1B
MSKMIISGTTNIATIYQRDAKGTYTKETELKKHIERVKSVDWAPNSNRIATCAGDRNAYVWNWDAKAGEWKPSLVLLRIERAATYIRYSISKICVSAFWRRVYSRESELLARVINSYAI